MLVDNEFRRDARFFNEAAARASLGARLGVPPAAVNSTTIATFIAGRTAGGLATNIGTFRLANDTIWPGATATNLRARLVQGGFSLYNGLQVQLTGRGRSGRPRLPKDGRTPRNPRGRLHHLLWGSWEPHRQLERAQRDHQNPRQAQFGIRATFSRKRGATYEAG